MKTISTAIIILLFSGAMAFAAQGAEGYTFKQTEGGPVAEAYIWVVLVHEITGEKDSTQSLWLPAENAYYKVSIEYEGACSIHAYKWIDGEKWDSGWQQIRVYSGRYTWKNLTIYPPDKKEKK